MGLNTDKVGFLVNPSSGTGSTRKQCVELEAFLLSEHPEALFESGSADEMKEIAKDLVQKNYRAIFACGGDGTLNLVSKETAGTDTAMAMIPLGSGNGFARHHHIPMHWNKAIKILENPKESLRDTGLINGIHFINVAGIGFAAKISHSFKGKVKRGLQGYAQSVISNLKMEPFGAVVSNENGEWNGETWMVEFCNGSQWGNNFRLEPGARDNDGALNAVVFKKMSPLGIPAMGFRFATNSVPKSSNVYTFSGAEFSMQFEGPKPLHVDGEAIAILENYAEVKVVSKKLKIWTF
jgi:diacylglycerol kinase (ATP)